MNQVFSCLNNYQINMTATKITNSLNSLIFDKLKKKSLERDKLFSLGEITNLSTVDSNRISNMGSSLSRILILPIEIVVGLLWMY